jgi:hypothetical protein
MNNKDSVEKKANIIWKVSFIITGLAFICDILFRNIDYSISMMAELIYFFIGLFGSAIFVQTNKPMIIKLVVVIILLTILFWGVGGVGLAFVAIIPYAILIGTSNLKNSKVKSYVIVLVILIIVTISLVYSIVADRHSDRVSGTIDVTEVRQYNAEFCAYDRESNVKGSNIKRLINDVLTHNKVNGYDTSLWINVHVDEKGSIYPNEDAVESVINDNGAEGKTLQEYNGMISEELSKIKTSKTYAVACGYDPVTGYVVDIEIVMN